MPDDKTGQDLRQQARQAQADARVVDQSQEKARKAYADALQAGQKALAANQYDIAIKAFNDAGRALPGDKTAQDLAAQAQRAWDAAKANQGAEQKRLTDFNQFVKQGQAALMGKRYAEAQQAYTAALKLFPVDATAQRGLRDAEAGLTSAGNEQKRFADYAQAIQQAQAAMQAKRYAEAQQAYTAALKLFPTDPTAQRGLQDATRALTPIPPP